MRSLALPHLPSSCHRHRAVSRHRTALPAVKKTFGSFAEMINDSDVPVLVDMYAEWCGPCKLLAPVLEQVSFRLGGPAAIKVVKINTEKYPAVASLFAVNALPTLILFKKGQPVDRLEGLPTADDLVARLRPHLS